MNLSGFSVVAAFLLAIVGSSNAAYGQIGAAESYLKEEIRIPYASAGTRGLEALFVRPNGPGRYPLALIDHGSPRSGDDRPGMTPWGMLPQAVEFARRGWAAAIVMRRGYGTSGGGWAEAYGPCSNPDYVIAGNAGAADLKAATSFLRTRPDIDPSRVISVGASAGGFATVALTADPPPGLLAAVNFAGGRGSTRPDEVCREDRLVNAFRSFGARSRIPMLWVYARNDHFFGPQLAQQFKNAFAAGGGDVEFIVAPAFDREGHDLFSMDGIPIWTRYVDDFLLRHNLKLRSALTPRPEYPALALPGNMTKEFRNASEIRSGKCSDNNESCVIFVDEAAVSMR